MGSSSGAGLRPAALYLCYYDVVEPLVHTQVIAYLRQLAARGVETHLLTFDRRVYGPEETARIEKSLTDDGIQWHSLRYHAWPSLPATLWDILCGALWTAWFVGRRRIRLLHARSHVAAAMALPVRWLCRVPLLFDVRGLLADEYADAGHWSRGGLKYWLTKAAERVLLRHADGLVFLTHAIVRDLTDRNVLSGGDTRPVVVIPCCVALSSFEGVEAGREALREAHGFRGRTVLAYVGKLGGWYLVPEMVRFFAIARQADARAFLFVLTQSDPRELRKALLAEGLPADTFRIETARPEDVPGLLAAADAGLSFVRTCYSKRSSSPTKVGEYWAAGLPVVSTPGIGDLDVLLSEPGLGVTVEPLNDSGYQRAAEALQRLVDEPETRSQCRAVALRELSMDEVGGPRYAALYARLLGAPLREGERSPA